MAGIIGFVIGWAVTLFIICYFDKDAIWYRKFQKRKFRFKDYNKLKLNIGSNKHYIRWMGTQLEIRGEINV